MRWTEKLLHLSILSLFGEVPLAIAAGIASVLQYSTLRSVDEACLAFAASLGALGCVSLLISRRVLTDYRGKPMSVTEILAELKPLGRKAIFVWLVSSVLAAAIGVGMLVRGHTIATIRMLPFDPLFLGVVGCLLRSLLTMAITLVIDVIRE